MIRVQFAIIGVLTLLAHGPAFAQFDRGGDPREMADRFFGMMDRNRDGRLDEDETQRLPPPMRDAMQKMGADFRRGISSGRFSEMLPRAMEEMRRSRDSGGFGGPPGGGFGGPPGGGFGGPPGGGFGGPPGGDRGYGDRSRGDADRGDGRGSSDYRRDDGRSRDSRNSFSSRGDSRGRSSRSAPQAPPRVTVDLPESWKVADLDRDGQIGLYEWDRKKYSEFFTLDTNHDGLLTPREISRASGSSPAPAAAVAATTVLPSGSTSTPAAKPVAATPSGAPLAAAEYDEKSAEGRWAKYVFGRLDKNKDGSLSEDEWNASAKTRDSFKQHNAQITFPAKFEAFAGLMVAVQQADRKK
ncbi:MAG: hypothetical protein HQ518_04945 [Rhodopirellula sp.]|nr:hypothetical protein [Rhodopirellula sp.]